MHISLKKAGQVKSPKTRVRFRPSYCTKTPTAQIHEVLSASFDFIPRLSHVNFNVHMKKIF